MLLAAEKAGAALLKSEFPSITILPLKGYRVQYSRYAGFFWLKMLSQLPKIWMAINHEKKWLNKIIKTYKVDIVISDNRFGMYNNNVPCIFITHQLGIKTGNFISDKITQKINYHYINKFNNCWVIDEFGKNNIAGELSHPQKLPIVQLNYIGILSRLQKTNTEKKIDLLVLLSGPEPQRSILEKKLLIQMQGLQKNMVLVRGVLNSAIELPLVNNQLEIYDYLPSKKLNELILSSQVILSRGGYTSMMDFAILNTKSIVIPTPGQTEQEYLATYLSGKKYCIASTQSNFNLKELLAMAEKIEQREYPAFDNKALKQAIKRLL